MIFALSTAFALDCTGLVAETCDAVNELEAIIEATEGNVIDPAAVARLRPTTLYDQLESLRQSIGNDGCRADFGFDGIDGGAYGTGSFGGDWSGTGSGSGTGSTGGTYGGNTVAGTFGGDATGGIGDVFGSYNRQGQVVANREGGFVAGRWIRTTGKQGVYVALHGDCDAGVDAWDALDPWYVGALPAPAVGDDVTFELTVDDNLIAWFVDGVQVPFDSSTDNAWQFVKTHTMSLSAGTHVIAIQGTDNSGFGMAQFKASDSDGGVLRVSDTSNWAAWDVTSNGVPVGWEQPSFDDSAWPSASLCGSPPVAPWNSDPVGGGDADFIWAGSCSAVNSMLLRTTITL